MGGFNRSERVKKLNRLIEIEEYLTQNGLIDYCEYEEIPDQYADMLKAYTQSLDDHKNRSNKQNKV